jgi:hypothetical protein
MMADNLTKTNESGYLNNTVRQRMPKRFDRNGLKNLTHLHHEDKQFAEYVINLMKLRPSVMLQKSGRPFSVTSQENEMLLSQAFTKSPQKSKQRASIELGISRTSLSRLMQRLGLKIYRTRLLHWLLEDDPDHRLQFCEVVLNDERQGSGITDKITWSDKAHLKISGAINWHTCVYYSTKKSPCNDRRTAESAGDYSLGKSFM